MILAEDFMRQAQVSRPSALIKNPEVSIILPTYCRGDNGLLRRAIESVLSQSMGDFELLVMDDGSIDGTADLVDRYVAQDNRVIHVRHDENCGLPALRVNEGLLMARGPFCAYQFDDDRWTQNCLSAAIGALRKHPTSEVAYGVCKYIEGSNEYYLGGAFDFSQLVNGNCIPNNCVIHRRSVFERLGGYDMHLVMRRLCDWDLWLRWARETSFLPIGEVISIVEAGIPDSIGKTVAYDSFVTRAHMSLARNQSLRPPNLKSFVVDDLHHLGHLGPEKVNEVWRRFVAPYRSQRRHVWKAIRCDPPKKLHVLVTKAHFDTTIDITIGNFAESLSANFSFTYVPQYQVDEQAIGAADVLLLHRTMDQHAEQLAELARRHRKPVIYLMDDDLLSFAQLGEEFSYLLPGQPHRLALENLIREADVVITYSPLIRESAAQLNPRHLLLETNIRAASLGTARKRMEQAQPGNPVRIGFAGGGARKEEIARLWPAIVEASRRLGPRVEFFFWGITPERLDELNSPYRCEPFTFSYHEYLHRLVSQEFDVMIAPLFGEKRAKRAKCPIKFLECTAAGAVGVYSTVEPYEVVEDGVNGIKTENEVAAWTTALVRAAEMPHMERRRMVEAAIRLVEERFTSETQASRLAASLEGAVLHARLRRGRGGKPRLAFVCHSPYLAGAENILLRHAETAQEFQFEPVLVLPKGARGLFEEVQRRADMLGIVVDYLPFLVETEVNTQRPLDFLAIKEIEHWLRREQIALVHSVTLLQEVGQAARRASIPHVTSVYQTNSQGYSGLSHCDGVHSDSLLYANRWGEILGVPAAAILSHVPDSFFRMPPASRIRSSPDSAIALRIALFGTVQQRKGQLQAIEAVSLLRQIHGIRVSLALYGYTHFYEEYTEECRRAAERCGIADDVSFEGFVSEPETALECIDAVLCASDWESLPLVVLEAMAAGRMVIASNIGGVSEVISRRTGILAEDNSSSSLCKALYQAIRMPTEEWRSRVELAREVARSECQKYEVAVQLFRLYQQAAVRRASLQTVDPEPEVADRDRDGASHRTVSASDQLEILEGLRAKLREITDSF